MLCMSYSCTCLAKHPLAGPLVVDVPQGVVQPGLKAAADGPILDRFKSPVDAAQAEKRWLDGLYLDQPEELDDPYRFFRW